MRVTRTYLLLSILIACFLSACSSSSDSQTTKKAINSGSFAKLPTITERFLVLEGETKIVSVPGDEFEITYVTGADFNYATPIRGETLDDVNCLIPSGLEGGDGVFFDESSFKIQGKNLSFDSSKNKRGCYVAVGKVTKGNTKHDYAALFFVTGIDAEVGESIRRKIDEGVEISEYATGRPLTQIIAETKKDFQEQGIDVEIQSEESHHSGVRNLKITYQDKTYALFVQDLSLEESEKARSTLGFLAAIEKAGLPVKESSIPNQPSPLVTIATSEALSATTSMQTSGLGSGCGVDINDLATALTYTKIENWNGLSASEQKLAHWLWYFTSPIGGPRNLPTGETPEDRAKIITTYDNPPDLISPMVGHVLNSVENYGNTLMLNSSSWADPTYSTESTLDQNLNMGSQGNIVDCIREFYDSGVDYGLATGPSFLTTPIEKTEISRVVWDDQEIQTADSLTHINVNLGYLSDLNPQMDTLSAVNNDFWRGIATFPTYEQAKAQYDNFKSVYAQIAGGNVDDEYFNESAWQERVRALVFGRFGLKAEDIGDQPNPYAGFNMFNNGGQGPAVPCESYESIPYDLPNYSTSTLYYDGVTALNPNYWDTMVNYRLRAWDSACRGFNAQGIHFPWMRDFHQFARLKANPGGGWTLFVNTKSELRLSIKADVVRYDCIENPTTSDWYEVSYPSSPWNWFFMIALANPDLGGRLEFLDPDSNIGATLIDYDSTFATSQFDNYYDGGLNFNKVRDLYLELHAILQNDESPGPGIHEVTQDYSVSTIDEFEISKSSTQLGALDFVNASSGDLAPLTNVGLEQRVYPQFSSPDSTQEGFVTAELQDKQTCSWITMKNAMNGIDYQDPNSVPMIYSPGSNLVACGWDRSSYISKTYGGLKPEYCDETTQEVCLDQDQQAECDAIHVSQYDCEVSSIVVKDGPNDSPAYVIKDPNIPTTLTCPETIDGGFAEPDPENLINIYNREVTYSCMCLSTEAESEDEAVPCSRTVLETPGVSGIPVNPELKNLCLWKNCEYEVEGLPGSGPQIEDRNIRAQGLRGTGNFQVQTWAGSCNDLCNPTNPPSNVQPFTDFWKGFFGAIKQDEVDSLGAKYLWPKKSDIKTKRMEQLDAAAPTQGTEEYASLLKVKQFLELHLLASGIESSSDDLSAREISERRIRALRSAKFFNSNIYAGKAIHFAAATSGGINPFGSTTMVDCSSGASRASGRYSTTFSNDPKPRSDDLYGDVVTTRNCVPGGRLSWLSTYHSSGGWLGSGYYNYRVYSQNSPWTTHGASWSFLNRSITDNINEAFVFKAGTPQRRTLDSDGTWAYEWNVNGRIGLPLKASGNPNIHDLYFWDKDYFWARDEEKLFPQWYKHAAWMPEPATPPFEPGFRNYRAFFKWQRSDEPTIEGQKTDLSPVTRPKISGNAVGYFENSMAMNPPEIKNIHVPSEIAGLASSRNDIGGFLSIAVEPVQASVNFTYADYCSCQDHLTDQECFGKEVDDLPIPDDPLPDDDDEGEEPGPDDDGGDGAPDGGPGGDAPGGGPGGGFGGGGGGGGGGSGGGVWIPPFFPPIEPPVPPVGCTHGTFVFGGKVYCRCPVGAETNCHNAGYTCTAGTPGGKSNIRCHCGGPSSDSGLHPIYVGPDNQCKPEVGMCSPGHIPIYRGSGTGPDGWKCCRVPIHTPGGDPGIYPPLGGGDGLECKDRKCIGPDDTHGGGRRRCGDGAVCVEGRCHDCEDEDDDPILESLVACPEDTCLYGDTCWPLYCDEGEYRDSTGTCVTIFEDEPNSCDEINALNQNEAADFIYVITAGGTTSAPNVPWGYECCDEPASGGRRPGLDDPSALPDDIPSPFCVLFPQGVTSSQMSGGEQ